MGRRIKVKNQKRKRNLARAQQEKQEIKRNKVSWGRSKRALKKAAYKMN